MITVEWCRSTRHGLLSAVGLAGCAVIAGGVQLTATQEAAGAVLVESQGDKGARREAKAGAKNEVDRNDADDSDDAGDAGDAALLSELKQLEDEWRIEEEFDDAQLFPPGQGSAVDLEGEDQKAYASIVAQLFEAGLGSVPAGAGADAFAARQQQLYGQLLQLCEDDPRLPWLGSLVLSRAGKARESLTLLARGLELSPQQSSTLLLQRASLELDRDDSAAALKTCRAVVDRWPADDGSWPGDQARATQAYWLGQIVGFVAGGEKPPTSRVDEFRRLIERRWPAALVAGYEREFERVRNSRQESRRRQSTSLEQQQADARQTIENLKAAIEQSRASERQLRTKLDNLKSPHEEQLDHLIETLKQKLKKLNAAQTQARRLAARLKGTAKGKTGAGKGPAKGKGGKRGQVRKQLKKSLEEVRTLQQEMTAGQARRKELEARHAAVVLPVKQEWNQVRLSRQAKEKELEKAQEVLATPAGSPPVPQRFRDWRTLQELDLVQDLREHWQE